MEGLFYGSMCVKCRRVGELVIRVGLDQGLPTFNTVGYWMSGVNSNDVSKRVFGVRGYMVW